MGKVILCLRLYFGFYILDFLFYILDFAFCILHFVCILYFVCILHFVFILYFVLCLCSRWLQEDGFNVCDVVQTLNK